MNKFKLGSWLVEPNKSLLTSNSGKEVRIEPLNMALLCYFAQNPGEPINREKLIEDVWGNKIVTDHAVYKTINQLRKYLASDGDPQDYIKTVPKKGYSLIAPLEAIIEVSPKEAVNLRIEATSENRFKKWFYKHPVVHTLGLLLMFGLLIWNLGFNSWWYQSQQPIYSNVSTVDQIEGILDQAIPSPNEEWLAITSFGDQDTNNRKIYLLNIKTQEKYQLTDGEYDYSKISWSSSGKNLIASRKPNSAFNSDYCDLVILRLAENFQGLESQQLITSCSPRGSSAQYDEENEVIYYNFAKSNIVPSSLYSYSLKTQEIELLSNPGNAVWGDWSVRLSPDRKKLIYIRVYEEVNELFLYDIESQQEELLFSYIGYVDQISWADDGSTITYQPNKNQVAVYSIDDDYHKTVISKDDAILSSYHSVTTDTIYTVSRVNDIEIVQLEVSDPSSLKVVNSSKAMEFSGAYASTSDNYAFVSKRSGNWQLWLQTDNKLRMLTNNETEAVIFTPTWSFDDKKIVFNKSGQIHVHDLELNETNQVYSEEGAYLQNPFWSPDAKSIYFAKLVENTNQIFRLDLASGKAKQITSDGGYAGTVARDNSAIYLVKENQVGLWQLSLSNLKERKVNDIATSDDLEFIHSVENGIYFSNLKGYEKSLYFVDINSLSTKKLLDIKSKDSAGFSVNFTQDKALTTVTRAYGSSLAVYRPK